MDKQRVMQTMLNLEQERFDASQDEYLAFVASARLDRSEPIENDEQAQAEFASDLSEAFDHPVHAHADKIAKLRQIDFNAKTIVEEGAIVKMMGRHFVISVATDRFVVDGIEMMGISVHAPLFRSIRGKSAGDIVRFNGRHFAVDLVA